VVSYPPPRVSFPELTSAALTAVAVLSLSLFAPAPARAAIARIDNFTAQKKYNTVAPFQRVDDRIDYSFHMEWSSSGRMASAIINVVDANKISIVPLDKAFSSSWWGSPVDQTAAAYHSPINGGLNTDQYRLWIYVQQLAPPSTIDAEKEAYCIPQ
jgi:hypothetical protein